MPTLITPASSVSPGSGMSYGVSSPSPVSPSSPCTEHPGVDGIHVKVSVYNATEVTLRCGKLFVGEADLTPDHFPDIASETTQGLVFGADEYTFTGRLEFRLGSTEITADLEAQLLQHSVTVKEVKHAGENRVWIGTCEPFGKEGFHLTLHLMCAHKGTLEKDEEQFKKQGFVDVDSEDEDDAFSRAQKKPLRASKLQSEYTKAHKFDPYVYPEKNDEEFMNKTTNSAFCFSGGGSRAYAAAWGQFRAMKKLNMFEKIRYLSCVSGGNWACTALVYKDAEHPDETFLGDFLYDDQTKEKFLTMDLLNDLPEEKMGFPARGDKDISFTSQLLRNMGCLSKNGNTNDFWNMAVADRFLKPFGVPIHKAMAWTPNSIDKMVARNSHLCRNDFAMQDLAKPYIVINSLLIAPYPKTPTPGHKLDEQMQIFESSALSCGVPTDPREIIYSTRRSIIGRFARLLDEWFGDGEAKYHTRQITIGGGSVEPIGHNGAALYNTIKIGSTGIKGANLHHVHVDRLYSIRDACGTSSTAYAGFAATRLPRFCPRQKYETLIYEDTPKERENSDAFYGNKWAFGDAGLADNFGLIAMLRREVKNIVVFVNTMTPLASTMWDGEQTELTESMFDLHSDKQPADKEGNLVCDNVLLAFFGWYAASSFVGATKNLQCFPKKAFWPIIKELQEAALTHRPVVAHAHDIDVLPNKFHGVKGGVKANITFVYLAKQRVGGMQRGGFNQRRAGFNKFMGEDAYNKYVKKDDAYFESFPNLATAMQNSAIPMFGGLIEIPLSFFGYAASEVNLLAEYTCWTMYTWFGQTLKGREVYEELTGSPPDFPFLRIETEKFATHEAIAP